MNIYNNLKVFLTQKQRYFFSILVVLMAASAFLEILGIGSIPIFVAAVLDYEFLKSSIDKYQLTSLSFVLKMDQDYLLFVMSICLLGLFIFKNLFLMLIHYLQSYFAFKIVTSNSSKVFKKYIFNNYSFYANRNSASLIKNIVSEINISSSFLSSILFLFRELLIFSLICILLLLNSPSSFLYISFIFIFFLIIFYLTFKNKVSESGKKFYKSRDQLVFTIQQSLGFIKEVILLNKRELFYEKFKKNLYETEYQNVFMSIINKVPRLFFEIIAVLICLLIVNYFFKSSRNDMLPLLTLYGVSLIRLIPSYTQISQSIMNIRYYKISFDFICNELKIKDIIDESKIIENNNSELNYKINKNIIIEDLSFSYEANKIILNNINFKFQTGQAIGIMGASGSGKTTLGDLFLGLYHPNKGRILFDGINISNYPVEWKKIVGYVPQDVFILDSDIKCNIASEFDEKKINFDKLNEAIKFSNCNEFINELPNGIDTKVGENGIKLSGGQKQRIGIARALYNRPKIVLFDEATSALDVKNESEIIKSIISLKENKTLICISHKLSNLKNMDKIIIIKKGKIDKIVEAKDINSYIEQINFN